MGTATHSGGVQPVANRLPMKAVCMWLPTQCAAVTKYMLFTSVAPQNRDPSALDPSAVKNETFAAVIQRPWTSTRVSPLMMRPETFIANPPEK